MDTFYGFKLGQDQKYDSTGRRVPVTMVKAEPMKVLNSKQVKIGKFIRSIKLDELDKLDQVPIGDVFNIGDKIKVTGTSKGKGFAGVVKRHGFKGGPKTHGQSNRQRHGGSIGQTTTPGRVYKGKRMAGHMGNVQKTTLGLKVFDIKPEENLLLIQGLIPGNKNGLIKICKS